MDKTKGIVVNRIVEYREKNHLSQETLARNLGVPRAAVANWEACRNWPRLDDALIMAKFFKCSVEDIFKIQEITWKR